MRHPDIYTAKFIQEWGVRESVNGGPWIPSRPIPFQGWAFRRRLRAAWRVFIGRYDALDWQDHTLTKGQKPVIK